VWTDQRQDFLKGQYTRFFVFFHFTVNSSRYFESLSGVFNADPMIDGSRRSDLMIGGVIGGTAAALVGVIIIIVIVRLCRQWRQYQKAMQRALGELQCNSLDGSAITPSAARRESLLGTLLSFFSQYFCDVLRPVHIAATKLN